MTGTTGTARLRALLHDATTAPAEVIAGLAAERAALAGGTAIAHELLDVELRWLAAQPEARAPDAAAALATARRDALALRVRGLAVATDDEAATLFDLAEARAAAETIGDEELARQCDEALERGVARVEPGAALDQEAAERFAALTTAVDDVPIDHQIRLLRSTGELALALAARSGSRQQRRIGRRLVRAADDRELARRLENLIGARGIAVVETTNFVLLLVVLLTLLVEATVDLTVAQANALHWIDALACSFFVLDFLVELVLHPRRLSWFLRNAVTDLLPAIPAVLFLLPDVAAPGAADNLVLLRVLRLLRVTWAARYVQALRPMVRSARLLLFLVRGLDGLIARFAQILNRDFVFVPAAAEVRRSVPEEDQRDLLFAALRREHELCALLPPAVRSEIVLGRLRELDATLRTIGPCPGPIRSAAAAQREVPIDEAIEFLWSLRPQDVGRWLRRSDIASLDRVLRVLSAVPVRWLPIVRRFAVHPLPASPEERIVQLGRRVAEWLESWHGRMLFFADLHGIVTGPQILDRVATAMVKASQRPAVRLLLFGGLFSVLRLFWADNCLSRIVGLPLVLLGGVCLVFLSLGWWLKRLAGEASETYRLCSEAHFISQLERIKPRYERQDLGFLARRVFGERLAANAEAVLRRQLASARTGVPIDDADVPAFLRHEANRVVLLYLHFLDGAPLHTSDVKTTEQLLANQSLDNLRRGFLRLDARERRRLRKLKLDAGSVLSGPFLWFSFITESVAVEAAKRIAGYNQFCVPLAERAHATPEQLESMRVWLAGRVDPRGGRTIARRSTGALPVHATTEFTALDFLGGDEARDRHIAAMFGDDVLAVVEQDRRTMVREIFGTRPVHHLPRHERSFNPLRFHQRRLSHGRVLLAPLLLLWRFVHTLGWLVARVRQIVREVLDPEFAMQSRQIGQAPFAVALRKIHRMKAPGLLEAIRMRLALDPVYAGAPPGWSRDEPFVEDSELERDIAFLHLRERQAAQLRDRAEAVRRHVGELHAALGWLPDLGGASAATAEARAAGELAVTAAWIADKDHCRTLLAAERWRAETLPVLLEQDLRPSWGRALWHAFAGLFVEHPVDRWFERHGRGLPRRARAVLRRAHAADVGSARRLIDAWAALPSGASPAECAIASLRTVHRQGEAVQRDLLALRAVQSLAVLDVRNYRDLVFQIGDYASDGEDPRLGGELP